MATPAPDHEYFLTNPPPKKLPQHSQLVQSFIAHHAPTSQRIALVTSGGTTVPLETNMVRFVDNFSAGTRGATSAEQFLEAGYAVIFLHREHSLLPYSRHYSHSTNCFLDYMALDSSTGKVSVAEDYQERMGEVLGKYRTARDEGKLLLVSFTTVNDYLWELREMAMLMRPLGGRVVFYLAAAVSDFFIPAERMVEHKIQSSEEFNDGGRGRENRAGSDGAEKMEPAARIEGKRLVVDLDPVPKFLKTLVDGWAPEGMIVSFKLETDPALLVKKAQYALKKYSHHLVIGNLLSTRKWEVVFVSAQRGEQWIRVPRNRRNQSISGSPEKVKPASQTDGEVTNGDVKIAESEQEAVSVMGDPPIEIESLIIPEVASLHDEHIKRSQR